MADQEAEKAAEKPKRLTKKGTDEKRAARFPLDGTIFNESPELLEERMKDAKFVEDRTKMQELLKWSRKRMLTDGVNGSKVFKEANDTNRTISRVHGQVAGLCPGDVFYNRLELAIVGVHHSPMKGIDTKGAKPSARGQEGMPAYAIAVNGGYQDDEDEGDIIWYTGAGGQDESKKQVRDQDFNGDNEGLRLAQAKGTPVRVVRGTGEKGGGLVYEGLFRVVDHKKEVSKDGPFVLKFLLERIQGESKTALHKVEFKPSGGAGRSRHRKIQTSGRSLAADASQWFKNAPYAEVIKSLDTARLAATRKWCELRAEDLKIDRPVLLTEDLSGGKEAVAIPVINDVDDEAAPDFHYITDYIGQDDPDVARVLKAMKKEGAAFHRGDVPCGIDFLKGAWDPRFAQDGWDPEQVTMSSGEFEYYHSSGPHRGRPTASNPLGYHECIEENCQRCRKENRRAALGIRLPLEVFRTRYRGWGVRSRIGLPAGAYVMSYYGRLMTDAQAEEIKKQEGKTDRYLFGFDHFFAALADREHARAEGAEEGGAGAPAAAAEPHATPARRNRIAAGGAGAGPVAPPAEAAVTGAAAEGPEVAPDEILERAQLLLSGVKSAWIREHLPTDGCLLAADGQSDSNVTRFVNSSCAPNLIALPVTYKAEHGVAFYAISFFVSADRDILPMQELSYNYGELYLGHMDFCLCGAPECKKPPPDTWRAAHPDWPACQATAPTYGLRAGLGKERAAAELDLTEQRNSGEKEERRLREQAYERARRAFLKAQRGAGICDEAVLEAMWRERARAEFPEREAEGAAGAGAGGDLEAKDSAPESDAAAGGRAAGAGPSEAPEAADAGRKRRKR